MKNRGQVIHTAKERLKRLSSVDNETGCIEWTGTTRNGYGRLIIGSRTDGSRKSVSAHRLAYETYVGDIPDGLYVLHKCDNRPCINPDHLFLGTHQDNVDDMMRKGRDRRNPLGKHEQHSQAVLTWEQVGYIRTSCKQYGDITAVAKELGLNRRTVSDVVNFVTWLPQPPSEDTKE